MREIEAGSIKEFRDLDLKKIYYIGNLSLLDRPKISIVGSRRASSYTKEFTYKIAKELSKRGFVIVSGGAMGVDALAHKGAGAKNSIAVMATGLDIRYPAINKNLIKDIEESGLVISRFQKGFFPTKWSFVVRNEMVVSLGEFLIITEADMDSGSMRSAKYAIEMKKEIFVLPHRLNESLGTNYLLKNDLAKAIYDIDEFCNSLKKMETKEDDFIKYLKTSPLYLEAIKKYKEKIFEAEILGEIDIINGKIYYKGNL